MSQTRSRRRKTQPSSDDQDSSASVTTKRAKLDTNGTLDGAAASTIKWEIEASKSTWTPYSDEHIKTITEAFKTEKADVDITDGKAELTIIFERMVQRNKKSGWERRIRCVSTDGNADPDEYTWEREDGQGIWTEYSKPTVNLLEAASLCGLTSVKLKEDKKDLIVDLTKNVQTTKSRRGSKNVRRIKSSDTGGSKDSTTTKGSSSDSSIKNESKTTKEKATRAKKGSTTAKASNSDTSVKKENKVKKGEAASDVKTETGEVKSVVFSGKAPVDSHCTIKDKTHVFTEGDDIWDVMLNQTNVANNNNKYYLIQLLEDNSAKKYYVWQRWGRVGFSGQNNLVTSGADLTAAKRVFTKKFSDKTKNSWENRQNFEKVPGKYDLLIMDYNADQDKNDAVDAAPIKEEKPVTESKLDERIQSLIELICNIQVMEEILKEMKYDTKKAPLGKLTTDQIKAGYEALEKIDACIRNSDFGSTLVKACDEFYTRIPHCFGMKRPPLIRTTEEVKIKLNLLEALGDIQIAVKALQEEEKSLEHPLDKHYKTLQCALSPLDHECDDFKMIGKYLENTHADTHNQYHMELLDVFALDRGKKSFSDVGNRMLLWHGSRLTNWVGILSQGLRIAPPEAPVTGYMFGKGIYFADMSSKSANYCFASKSKNVGLLVLSEVSLGKCNELLSSDYTADKLPPDCHSVKGMGKVAPDPNDTFTMPDGVVVPFGKSAETGVVNPRGYTLNYNEYIVYNTNQVRMRFLVKVKFNFK